MARLEGDWLDFRRSSYDNCRKELAAKNAYPLQTRLVQLSQQVGHGLSEDEYQEAKALYREFFTRKRNSNMDTAVDIPSQEAWTECRECIPDVKLMASEAVRRFHKEHQTNHGKTITMEWSDLLAKIKQLKDTKPREWKGTFIDKRNFLSNYLRDEGVFMNHITWPEYIQELKPFLQTWTVQLKKTTHLCQHLLIDGKCGRQECDFQHPAAFLTRDNFSKLLERLTQDELSRTVLPAHTIAKFFYDQLTAIALMEFEGTEPPEIFKIWKQHLQKSARQDTYQDYIKMKEFIDTKREELYQELKTRMYSQLKLSLIHI